MRFVFILLFILPLLFSEAAGQRLVHNPDGYTKTADRLQSQNDTSCKALATDGSAYNQFQQYRRAYETFKQYIDKCALEKKSYLTFGQMTNSVSGMEAYKDTVWAEFRDWLRKVLYYNPDSNYYCEDLLSYASSFENYDERGNTPDFKTEQAILKYIIDSSYCSTYRVLDSFAFNTYYRFWKDTVSDPKASFDSSIPNIDQVNHSWLRGFVRDVSDGDVTIYKGAIGNIGLLNNPFSDEAELYYTIKKPTVAKLEVYDALGRILWTNEQGYLDPREYVVKVNSSSWSKGTYYARIVTLQSEVKTCKLIKTSEP